MRAIPAIAIVVGGWGAAACGGKCDTLVLEDTTEVFVSDGKIVAMVKRDTQPKPYAACLKLEVAREARIARDTQPKP